jgi:ferredoxin-NADP reductase
MNVTFVKSVLEAENIRTFYFKPEQAFRYTAGQFTELTLPHSNPDDRGSKRWFTLSSSPSQELLSITTKFDLKGSSFKNALQALQPGTSLKMADPMGDFVLPKLTQTPLIFIAAGIGITPFRSMLQWLADTGEERPIKLIYGVNNEDEIIAQDIFDAANVHGTIVVSNPSDAWGGERGHLTAEMIIGVEQPSDETQVYLSGPEEFVEKLAQDLQKSGVSPQQLLTDYFPNYA